MEEVQSIFEKLCLPHLDAAYNLSARDRRLVLQEVGFNLEGVARDGSVAAEPGPPVPAAGIS